MLHKASSLAEAADWQRIFDDISTANSLASSHEYKRGEGVWGWGWGPRFAIALQFSSWPEPIQAPGIYPINFCSVDQRERGYLGCSSAKRRARTTLRGGFAQLLACCAIHCNAREILTLSMMFLFKETFYGSFHGNEYLFTISILCWALCEVRLTGLCSHLRTNSCEMLLQVATVRIEREVLRIRCTQQRSLRHARLGQLPKLRTLDIAWHRIQH